MDKDLYLKKPYFNVENDTLFIRMPDENNVQISHKSENMVIRVILEEINLKKGEKTLQVFRPKEDFKSILIENDFFLKECQH
jgi:hypothetical protein